MFKLEYCNNCVHEKKPHESKTCVYLDTMYNESVLFYSIQIHSKPPKYLKWMLCWKLTILPLHKSFSRLEKPRRTKLGSLYNSKTLKEEKCFKAKRIVSLRLMLNFYIIPLSFQSIDLPYSKLWVMLDY